MVQTALAGVIAPRFGIIFFYFPEIAELKALAEASPNCGRWARDMGARPSIKATDPQFRGLNR
jgi:hypothetical protein